jgi:hypothetical protein
MIKLGSHWPDFYVICYFSMFRKYAQKIEVSLKSDTNNGYFTWREDLGTFMIVSISVMLRIRNVSDESCRENQNTHFVLNNFFRKSCRLWDNVGKCGTARQATGKTIRHIHFACWITKATDAHSECQTYIFFHGNNGYAKAFQCYVIRTLRVM